MWARAIPPIPTNPIFKVIIVPLPLYIIPRFGAKGKILRATEIKIVQKGVVIFFEGDPGKELFVGKSG
jgi:hypothetical protein